MSGVSLKDETRNEVILQKSNVVGIVGNLSKLRSSSGLAISVKEPMARWSDDLRKVPGS